MTIRQTESSEPAVDELTRSASPLERELKLIWEDLLGVSSIGPLDDFFDLGGHSLIAIAMMARLGAALGVKTFPIDVIATPTISSMTAAVLLTLERSMRDNDSLDPGLHHD